MLFISETFIIFKSHFLCLKVDLSWIYLKLCVFSTNQQPWLIYVAHLCVCCPPWLDPPVPRSSPPPTEYIVPCVSALMLPVSCWTIMSAARPHIQPFLLFISPGFWPSVCLFYVFGFVFVFLPFHLSFNPSLISCTSSDCRIHSSLCAWLTSASFLRPAFEF